MKKFFMMAMLAASMVMASCTGGVEAKAEEYVQQMVEAATNMDLVKIQQINNEVAEYTKTLNDEDKKLFVEAMQKYTEEHKAEIEKAVQGSLMNGINGIVGKAVGSGKVGAESIQKGLEGMTEGLQEMTEGLEDMVNSLNVQE